MHKSADLNLSIHNQLPPQNLHQQHHSQQQQPHQHQSQPQNLNNNHQQNYQLQPQQQTHHQNQYQRDQNHQQQKLKLPATTSALPRGWKREEFSRRKGLSNGKYQVHYINEEGRRFKNKCMLSRFMGADVDLTPFDWRTGKIDPFLKRKVERMIKLRESSDVNRKLRNDHTIKPPLRTTLSNFKLPVTIFRNQPKEQPPVQAPTNSVVTRQIQQQIKQANNHEQQRALLAAAEAKANNLKPRQIFWEKRLEGLNASINDENSYERFHLPSKIKPLVPNHLNDESVVRAIVASLYDRNNTVTVTGQLETGDRVNKNPAVFLDPYQPPTYPIVIDDNDLKRQEERVLKCRDELEKILKSTELSNNNMSADKETNHTQNDEVKEKEEQQEAMQIDNEDQVKQEKDENVGNDTKKDDEDKLVDNDTNKDLKNAGDEVMMDTHENVKIEINQDDTQQNVKEEQEPQEQKSQELQNPRESQEPQDLQDLKEPQDLQEPKDLHSQLQQEQEQEVGDSSEEILQQPEDNKDSESSLMDNQDESSQNELMINDEVDQDDEMSYKEEQVEYVSSEEQDIGNSLDKSHKEIDETNDVIDCKNHEDDESELKSSKEQEADNNVLGKDQEPQNIEAMF